MLVSPDTAKEVVSCNAFRSDPRASSAHWQLPAVVKYASHGVVRAVPPRETIRRAQAVLDQIGVTRVGEVTHLDRLGIPNFFAVRPRDMNPGISYYNGKGTTRQDALAGALMEAVERHGGEYCNYNMIPGTYDQIASLGTAIHPDEIVVPRARKYRGDLTLEWVQGFDLLRREATFVPMNCVVCPYSPDKGVALYYASTNGLASGNSLTEALCHALCEVIERDAMAIASTTLQLRPAVDTLLAEITDDEAGIGFAESQEKFPLIAHHGLPRRAALILAKMKRAGLCVYLRDLTCTAGVATISCTVVDEAAVGAPHVHGGCGTHPDARVALTRALTEAAQSRVACIQGGREDLPEIIRPTTRYDPKLLFGQGETIEFGEIPSYEHDRVDTDIRWLLDRLQSWGLDQAVAFDLTRPDVGIPVVRVVVPKAEAWTVFHLHTDRGVFGDRVAAVLRETKRQWIQ